MSTKAKPNCLFCYVIFMVGCVSARALPVTNKMEVDFGGSSVLFEDTFRVTGVDSEGKAFQKITRMEATSAIYEVELTLDVHNELYPVQVGEVHSLTLVSTISPDGRDDKGVFVPHETLNSPILAKADYCMYGKIFKFKEEKGGKISIACSFGGLLMNLKGHASDLHQLELDSNIYLLIRRFKTI